MDVESIKSLLFDEEDEMELVESVSSDEDDVGEDWSKRYDEISEFIADLDEEEADLACEAVKRGYVLFEKHPQQQLHLRQFLTTLSPLNSYFGFPYLVQFWGVTKVEGSHHYLSTKHQPFFVQFPNKGFSFYRKLCRNHVYVVDVQDDEDNHNIGGIGRVYRSKHPESTPDLRLYSADQFPMGDEAARCGFRAYVALPLFDSHTNQCYGVLEMLACEPLPGLMKWLLSALNATLEGGPVPAPPLVQYSQSGHLHTEEQQPKEHIVAASDSERIEGRNRKTSLHLNLEALEPHFGKKLKDVANELGVGRSTIKRACRHHGIDRWPSTQKQKENLSLFERERSGDSQHDTVPSTSNVTHANAEGAEKVMIKVKYGEDTIKFELCLSLGLAKLMEETATRLKLEMGTFKLKYFDEDGDEILLQRDDCLRLCRKSHIAMGKTFIQLFVRL